MILELTKTYIPEQNTRSIVPKVEIFNNNFIGSEAGIQKSMYYIFIFSRKTDKERSQICQWPQSHSRRRAVGRRQRQPAYRQKLTNFFPRFRHTYYYN